MYCQSFTMTPDVWKSRKRFTATHTESRDHLLLGFVYHFYMRYNAHNDFYVCYLRFSKNLENGDFFQRGLKICR